MTQYRNGRNVDIALVHHPVLGRKGETIGSAVTNLDLHDIARIARTYGVRRYYIVTPYTDQQELVREIIAHWQDGHGSTYNPARKEAFSLVRAADSLEDVISTIESRNHVLPTLVTTSAREQKKRVSYSDSRKRIDSGEQTLLVFGTAHGLAPEITDRADYTLPAIQGNAEYNHLSVRSAVAVICDRLLGNWKE
ncbi:MAG: RNA methyltransferase [Desulfopila sp.]|jgi:hypothetical protein|nr:RNA methyltransferase [Desulfopila sp.]